MKHSNYAHSDPNVTISHTPLYKMMVSANSLRILRAAFVLFVYNSHDLASKQGCVRDNSNQWTITGPLETIWSIYRPLLAYTPRLISDKAL